MTPPVSMSDRGRFFFVVVRLKSMDRFLNKYRIPAARADWWNYEQYENHEFVKDGVTTNG
ncbi:hypothetical protein BLX24_26000 [Arsenicibacter rosenii]|uniref:Uncharacterized protein n=1 Tax=Arsenicibacter rosenii TaxID=1750698 RepID=A0A1S2VC32_9BACT|nr:hypothetical protein BLX24_26000 [Arsenicibacter rosenii]